MRRGVTAAVGETTAATRVPRIIPEKNQWCRRLLQRVDPVSRARHQ
jgi:hypothetical protein